MAVDDAGHVFVFWTEAIRQGKYTPAASLQNDVSTWGLAMCASRPLIAVSANNFRASVWDLERTVLRRGRVELQGHSVRTRVSRGHPLNRGSTTFPASTLTLAATCWPR